MVLIIVIPIEDFQIRWNVLTLSFSERESRKWPLGLSDFIITISSVIEHLITGKIILLHSDMAFFVGF